MADAQHTPGLVGIRRPPARHGVARPPELYAGQPLSGHGPTVCRMGDGTVHYANHEANIKKLAACWNHIEPLMDVCRAISDWGRSDGSGQVGRLLEIEAQANAALSAAERDLEGGS